MAKRPSVYISQRALDVIGTVDEGESTSGRINAIIDRYGEIITRAKRDNRKTLNENDMQAIRIACHSWATKKEPGGILIGGIIAEVEDAAHGGDLDGYDAGALLEKLRTLSPAHQIALVEELESE